MCVVFQDINPVAAALMKKMLRADPTTRPTIAEVLTDEFFTAGYIPQHLPTTCLTVAPRFSIAPSSIDASLRKPLTALNKGKCNPNTPACLSNAWLAALESHRV